ncbi:hypothetical protein HYG86_12485 [Alkalicella caledoniensis]|uniref:PAS domain-containing protein n=1 Tax=Alkalicella caledoniensis TaxID=2731377 RepID=A0A7G9WA15_ALKCA|nr:hypothetical protein [Alkalicella caledoniensis]QNO15527.1 hypothetical protein HYG86_12485 [Alkalicella caledoniensis]
MDVDLLLNDNSFFKAIFNVIPAIALIMNEDGMVFTINEVGKNLLGLYSYKGDLRGGDTLKCINRHSDPKGCGFSPQCNDCTIRKAIKSAINGEKIARVKGKYIVEVKGEQIELNILISAALMEYQGQKLAISIIEDISELTELEGLIPICAHCKKIRDDDGYWNRVEVYIEKHTEAEFTHDVCPKCIETIKKSHAQLL